MRQGIVKFFNKKSKFGFIIDDETKQEYYVHAKETDGTLEEGIRVSFELKLAKKGYECVKVRKQG